MLAVFLIFVIPYVALMVFFACLQWRLSVQSKRLIGISERNELPTMPPARRRGLLCVVIHPRRRTGGFRGDAMFLGIKNLWWKWKNRCKEVRPSSAYMSSALMAQLYLADLRAAYKPCKVCDSRLCRWAIERPRDLANKEANESRKKVWELLGWTYGIVR